MNLLEQIDELSYFITDYATLLYILAGLGIGISLFMWGRSTGTTKQIVATNLFDEKPLAPPADKDLVESLEMVTFVVKHMLDQLDDYRNRLERADRLRAKWHRLYRLKNDQLKAGAA